MKAKYASLGKKPRHYGVS